MSGALMRHGVVAGLVVLLTAGCAGSSQTGAPTAQPSPTLTVAPTLPPTTAPTQAVAPTPAGGLIASPRFGYQLEVPPGWIYKPATEDWPADTYPYAGARYTDNWERSPGPFPVIDVSTQVVPVDEPRDRFLAGLDDGNAAIGCTVESTEELAVDGATGRFQRQACANGYEAAFEVVVFDRDRVYVIYWIGLYEDRAEDELAFRTVLDSFRFPAD